VQKRIFSFLGVCSKPKLLVPLVIIAVMPAAFLGPDYLKATEVTVEEAAVVSERALLFKALAANDQAVKAGDLAGLEPSRLLLLIVGVLMVGIAYQRSLKGLRNPG
jgi:hypothetical protein